MVGVAGLRLSEDERQILRRRPPWGFILFKRNCGSPEQVRQLVSELRGASSRPDAPILIDQEGGRVQRLQPPHWPARPPPGRSALSPSGTARPGAKPHSCWRA